MNGAHIPFVFVPNAGTKPPPEIKQKLQALREEFAKRLQDMKRTGRAQ